MKELTIHEIRDIQISILKQLKHYCDQNNLKYYLAYGTLIGAVRHQGFIPWDDDIDVMMPRGDYEKLIKDYNRGAGITEIREIRTDPAYIYPYAKLCRKDTVLLEKGVKCPAPLGINIDIFPLDNYMNNKALTFKLFIYRKCLTVKVSKFSSAARGLFKNILLLAAKIPLLCFSRTFFLKNIDKCARRYAERTTVYAANLVDICSYKKIYHKRIFAAVKAHVFEDAYYNIPDGYDEFLKITYGDYMKIPDASQQKTNHNFTAYLK